MKGLLCSFAIAVLVATGCGGRTTGATNIDSDSATLNARGYCAAGESGVWYYELQEIGSSTWRPGPEHGFSCSQRLPASGDAQLPGDTFNDLDPQASYRYRVSVRFSDGTTMHADKDGVVDGTNYDRFTTAPRYELTRPAATMWSESRFDVFVRANDHRIYHKWWDNGQGPDEGGWSRWENLGAPPFGAISAPAAMSGAPGSVNLVVRGADSRIWHRYYTSAGGWSDWGPLPSTENARTGPAITPHVNGVEPSVFYGDQNGAIWHTYYNPAGGLGWIFPGTLGGTTYGEPAATTTSGDVINVFARGGGNQLYHKYFDPAQGWIGWGPIPNSTSQFSPGASTLQGQPNVFFRGTSNSLLYHTYYNPGQGWILGSIPNTNFASGPAVASMPTDSGHLNTFTRRANGDVMHTYFTPTAGWVGPGSIGQPWPTSIQYGGVNQTIDTVAEVGNVVGAMNGAGSLQAARSLESGLSNPDRDYVQQTLLSNTAEAIEQEEPPSAYGPPQEPTAAELASLDTTPDEEVAAAAAGAPRSGCRTTESRRISIEFLTPLLPDLGWVSMRTRFCYNPRKHTASFGGQHSTDEDVTLGYAALGYQINWKDWWEEQHDWNGWPKGQVNIRRDFNVDYCPMPISLLTGCDTDERGKLVTFGRYDGSAVARAYHR